MLGADVLDGLWSSKMFLLKFEAEVLGMYVYGSGQGSTRVHKLPWLLVG